MAQTAVLWNIVNRITLFARKRRPIHPGANIDYDLVLWPRLMIAGIFLILAAIDDVLYGYDDYYYVY